MNILERGQGVKGYSLECGGIQVTLALNAQNSKTNVEWSVSRYHYFIVRYELMLMHVVQSKNGLKMYVFPMLMPLFAVRVMIMLRDHQLLVQVM